MYCKNEDCKRLPEKDVEPPSLEAGQKPYGHSLEEAALADPALKKSN